MSKPKKIKFSDDSFEELKHDFGEHVVTLSQDVGIDGDSSEALEQQLLLLFQTLEERMPKLDEADELKTLRKFIRKATAILEPEVLRTREFEDLVRSIRNTLPKLDKMTSKRSEKKAKKIQYLKWSNAVIRAMTKIIELSHNTESDEDDSKYETPKKGGKGTETAGPNADTDGEPVSGDYSNVPDRLRLTTSTFVQATLQEWIETGNSCFDFHEVLGLLKMDNKVSKAGKTDPELTDEAWRIKEVMAETRQKQRIESCGRNFIRSLQKYVPISLEEIDERDPANSDVNLAKALEENRKTYNLRTRSATKGNMKEPKSEGGTD